MYCANEWCKFFDLKNPKAKHCPWCHSPSRKGQPIKRCHGKKTFGKCYAYLDPKQGKEYCCSCGAKTPWGKLMNYVENKSGTFFIILGILSKIYCVLSFRGQWRGEDPRGGISGPVLPPAKIMFCTPFKHPSTLKGIYQNASKFK